MDFHSVFNFPEDYVEYINGASFDNKASYVRAYLERYGHLWRITGSPILQDWLDGVPEFWNVVRPGGKMLHALNPNYNLLVVIYLLTIDELPITPFRDELVREFQQYLGEFEMPHILHIMNGLNEYYFYMLLDFYHTPGISESLKALQYIPRDIIRLLYTSPSPRD